MAEAEAGTFAKEVQEHYLQVARNPGAARPHFPKKQCQQEGCDRGAWAQGYCDPHYQKLKSLGVIKAKRIVNDPLARFHASYKVNPSSGCWEWIGWVQFKSYPILSIGGKSKQVRAHRFSYQLYKGPIPPGLLVCHTCDNRRCVNPDHLFLGDDKVNMRDMVSKGRHGAQTGNLRPKITRAMARNIRIMYARGENTILGLSRIYGVDTGTISGILKGRAHLFVGR